MKRRSAQTLKTAPPVRYEVIDRGSGLWVRTTPDAVEFHLEGARATGFEVRGIAEVKVLARRARVPR